MGGAHTADTPRGPAGRLSGLQAPSRLRAALRAEEENICTQVRRGNVPDMLAASPAVAPPENGCEAGGRFIHAHVSCGRAAPDMFAWLESSAIGIDTKSRMLQRRVTASDGPSVFVIFFWTPGAVVRYGVALGLGERSGKVL